MAIKLTDIEAVLVQAGFERTGSSHFGDEYARTLSGGLRATAFAASTAGFFDSKKSDEARKVDFSLESSGTTYRCLSITALRSNLGSIVAELDAVAQTPELLLCPKCGTRRVHTKEATPGGRKFRPFLSCSGMMIVGSGHKKHVLCDGVSTKLPALKIFE